jgi:hypothetical protein
VRCWDELGFDLASLDGLDGLGGLNELGGIDDVA